MAVILGYCHIYSQYDPTKVNKKITNLYSQGLQHAEEADFKTAIQLIEQCINIDPKFVDGYLSLGGIYGQLKDYKNSTLYYEKGIAIDSSYSNGYKLPYSINLAGQGRFDEALQAINSLLNNPKIPPGTRRAADFRKSTFEFALDFAARHPNNSYQFSPINLGDSINTASSEYYPSVTINDSLFVFSRRGQGIREDFVESTLVAESSIWPVEEYHWQYQ